MAPRRRPNSGDRLSSLPDQILHVILSFLDEFSDVVQTTFLSRRWRSLWTTAPCLSFFYEDPAFINQSLLFFDAPQLNKLRVVDNKLDHYQDCWIRFAVRHNVQVLDLDPYSNFCYGRRRPKVHSSLYTCSSLQVLRLRFFDLCLPPSVDLRSLKTLDLEWMNVSENEMRILMDGCPRLEDLSLRYCNTDSQIRIHAPNLKRLRVLDCKQVMAEWSGGKENGVELSAPNLLSLRFEPRMRPSYYFINDVRSLVSASFDFAIVLHDNQTYDNGLDQWMRILAAVSHVKALKLCWWCVQVLSMREINHEPPLFLSATYLEIKTGLFKWDLLGMTYLLKGSFYLEERN